MLLNPFPHTKPPNLPKSTLYAAVLATQHICPARLFSARTTPCLGGGGCSAVEGLPRRTAGAHPSSFPPKLVARVGSPCRSLLLATSRWRSSSCKSSPCLLSTRTVPACPWRRSHSERRRCPAPLDSALGREGGVRAEARGTPCEHLLRRMLQGPSKCTAGISVQTGDDGRRA